MADFDETKDGGSTFGKLLRKLRGGDKTGDPSVGLDFLPGGYAERRKRRRTDTIMVTLLVIVVGAVGATWSFSEQALSAAEEEFREVDARYTEAAQRIEQVKQIRLKQKTVADRMELTASLLEKMPRSNLLAEVTNALPHGVSLIGCALEAKRQAPPPPPPSLATKGKSGAQETEVPPTPLAYNTTFTIEGVALTEGQVSDYIDALGKSGYFSSIDLRWVRKEKPRQMELEVRSFMIALTIDPNAEAQAPAPTQLRRPVEVPMAAGDESPID